MYVCKIYNASYDVLYDSFARKEIQLAMGWQCGTMCLNCFLKLLLLTVIGSSFRRCTGRLFQIVRAAKLNERFAVSVRLLGTSRSDLSDDLSDLTGTLSWRSDARYTRSLNWRMLKVVTAILNFFIIQPSASEVNTAPAECVRISLYRRQRGQLHSVLSEISEYLQLISQRGGSCSSLVWQQWSLLQT